MNVKLEGLLPQKIAAPDFPPAASSRGSGRAKAGSFQEVLAGELGKEALKISAHAEKRLQERKITLSAADLEKISRAVDLAAAKGVRDSLIIYGDLALVASVKNRTVVTALNNEAAAGRVFTNIDGAIVIK